MYDLTDSWLEMPNTEDFKAKHQKISKHVTDCANELLEKASATTPHTYQKTAVRVIEGVDRKPRLRISAAVGLTVKDINLTRAHYTLCWIDTVRELWAQYASIRQDVMRTPTESALSAREDHLHWCYVLYQATKDHLAKPNLDALFEGIAFLNRLKESNSSMRGRRITAFYEKYAPTVSKDKLHQKLMSELKLFRTDSTLKRAHRWLSSNKDPIDLIDLAQLAYLLRILHQQPNTYGESTHMVRTIVKNLNRFFNKTIDLRECLKNAMFLDPSIPASDLLDTTKFPCDLNAVEWKRYL